MTSTWTPGSSPSATRSSANPGNCRCTRPAPGRLPTTHASATRCARPRRVRASSSPPTDRGRTRAPSRPGSVSSARPPGSRPRPGVAAARLHDFRHSFAVRTLLDWHRTGVDVQARMLLAGDLSRARQTGLELLVSDRRAGAARTRRRPLGDDAGGRGMTLLAPTLQACCTDRLMTQRDASPHTIIAYRDTLRLLLRFATRSSESRHRSSSFADLDATLIAAVPHAPRDRTRQQRPDPQPAARGDPLALPLRRAPPPRTRRR